MGRCVFLYRFGYLCSSNLVMVVACSLVVAESKKGKEAQCSCKNARILHTCTTNPTHRIIFFA